MSARAFLDKVKAKYNIKSDLDFWLIFTTFSLAGSNIGFFRPKIFRLFGITHAHLWVKVLVILFFFVPFYQLSTLFYGTLLGQFPFFWERQKKLGRFLKRKLLRIDDAPIAQRASS